MVSSVERLRQLYQQCQEAYSDYVNIPNHAKSILQKGDENIDVPSNFYDAYNVPAELLFRELYGGKGTEGNRFSFDDKLLLMMHKKQTFDIKALKQSSKQANQRLRKRYMVYFEAYYHQSRSSLPLFHRQLSIDGVTFEWCSKKLFSQQVRLMESHEDASVGLYEQRCKQRFSISNKDSINQFNLHPIQATVMAFNELEAANVVSSRFDDFATCVNVIQTFGSQSYTMFSTGPKTKHKTVLVSIDVLLVKDPKGEVEILWDASKDVLPKDSITLTDNASKMKRFKKLLRAFVSDSASAVRLKRVTRELAQALGTDNPNLRQLSYWRCLELATAKSTHESRKEAEVISIFQNYYPESKHWKQMGELVKKLRNTYVHEGLSGNKEELNEYHLNWSQKYAECAFRVVLYIYDHRKIWKTDDDIDTFFDCYTQSDASLTLAGKFLRARRKK